MKQTIRIVVIVIILAAIGGALYLFQSSGIQSPGELISFTQQDGVAGGVDLVDSQRILSLFRDVSSITIDSGVILNPAFQILEPISVQIAPPDSIGRPNPFRPIGQDGRFIPVTSGSSFQNLTGVDPDEDVQDEVLDTTVIPDETSLDSTADSSTDGTGGTTNSPSL